MFNPLKVLPFIAYLLISCSAPTATTLCAPQLAGMGVYATPLANQDPDRNAAADPYNGVPSASCAPTATALPTPDGTPLVASAGDILNLDHNVADQALQTVAIGDDSLAIGWAQTGALWYATAHGGSSLKPTQLTTGQQIALTYSDVNRLHIAWEEDGRIYYAAADDGDTVTAAPSEVGMGTKPHVLVDDGGWTHVIYTDVFGHFQHRRDRGNGLWIGVAAPAPLGVWGGESLQIMSVPDNPETAAVDSAFFATVQNGNEETVVYRLDAPSLLNPQWQAVGRWTIPLAEQFSGSAHLDAIRNNTGEITVINTWVTKPLTPPTPFLELRQPRYFPVNPYAPNGIANGDYLHEGLNAVGWETTEYAHEAGIMQTFPTAVGDVVHVQAWAKAWSSIEYNSQINPADMRMQIGLDPSAGRNPDAATVVWSSSHSPTTDWAELSVQMPATSSQMTLFLRSRPDAARARSTAYFDDIRISNGTLGNGSFEEPFTPMSSDPDSQLPAQWEPFWEENANNAPPRQPYTGYAVISTNTGNTWTTPQVVMSNQSAAQGATGALENGIHPYILPQGQGVSLLYIYGHGDPAKDDDRRFGRLHTSHCDLTLTICADPPGRPLLPRTVLRPVSQLLTARDPFDNTHALAVWQMIQTDHERYDVLGTWIEIE